MLKMNTEDAFTLAAYRKCEAIADGLVLSLVVHGEQCDGKVCAEWIRDEIRRLMEPLLVAEATKELEPHHYHPSTLHMGDCSICGNVASHQIHNTDQMTPEQIAREILQPYFPNGTNRPLEERIAAAVRSLSADNEQLMNTIADMKIADDGTVEERVAELESHLSASHVRMAYLENDRAAWKRTAHIRYNELEQKNARIAELEAADEKWRIGKQELEAWKEKAQSVATINYKDTTFADEQTRSLGFEPRQLQLAWRNNPPPYGQEAAGRSWHWVCEQAIIDALIHEGIPAWHGDAVSCVAQIVEAYAKRIAELEKKLDGERSLAANIIGQYERGSALRACLTLTPSLMDGEQAKARLREINSYIYSVLP